MFPSFQFLRDYKYLLFRIASRVFEILPARHREISVGEFKALKDLVKPGGRYDGYTVVIQGDNAGPHNDATYLNFVKQYCTREGWHWEPQGPQMPHMNVLDLSVFPNMSRRHTQLARDNYGMHVLKEDEIFDVAQQVYDNLPSSKIASGFIQAHRLAKRIIEHGSDNCFLSGGSGGISTGI